MSSGTPSPRLWRRSQEGGVSIVTGLIFFVLAGAAAFSVDLGSIFLHSRRLQGVADLAAMSAARDLARAEAAALSTVRANLPGDPATVSVVTGAYVHDRSLPPGQRFAAGGARANAVRVTVRADAELFFGRLLLNRSRIPVSRQAVAARAELAAFSIGSRLAGVNGGALNQLLGALTGSAVNLSVSDYNALAGASVDLFSYTAALRTAAALEAGSFDDVLAADLTQSQALNALAHTLSSQGAAQAAAAIQKLAGAAGAKAAGLDRLLDLGPYSGQEQAVGGKGAAIQVGAMDLASAMLQLSNAGRQVKLDLGGGAPGLAELDVWLAFGDRPAESAWLTVDDDGEAIIRTSQTRLYVEAKAATVLGLLGLQPVKLPLFVETAAAEARVEALACPAETSLQAATLAVRAGVGQAAIAEVDPAHLGNFRAAVPLRPATFVDLALVKASGQAQAAIGGEVWRAVRFSRSEIDAGVMKSVAATDVAQSSVSSLLGRANLKVTLLGLGLNLGQVTSAVAERLAAMTPAVDGVLSSMTGMLGVRLGEADVRVNGLRCRSAALVG